MLILSKKQIMLKKIKEIKSKCFTIFDINRFTSNILDAKIKNKELVNKSDISGFINNTDLVEPNKKLATKVEL